MNEEQQPGTDPETGETDDVDASEYDMVTAELALALPPLAPRPDVRARVLDAIVRTPQLSGGQDGVAAATDATDTAVTTRAGRAAGREAEPARRAAHSSAAPTPLVRRDGRDEDARADGADGELAPVVELRRWRRAATWLGAAAAVLLVAGVALGGWAGNLNQQRVEAEQRLTQQDSTRNAALQVFTAPDAVIRAGQSGNGGSISIASSRSLNRSAVIGRDLPALSDDQTYEMWYITGQQARPAGTFSASGVVTYTSLEGELDGATHIGVTVEPAGGSQAPTTTPLTLQPTAA